MYLLVNKIYFAHFKCYNYQDSREYVLSAHYVHRIKRDFNQNSVLLVLIYVVFSIYSHLDDSFIFYVVVSLHFIICLSHNK